MTFEEEYEELIRKRDSLLKEKEINKEKIEELNKLIDYYTWAYNRCIHEILDYDQSILFYKRMLNRPKQHELFDFSFFDTNFDRYYSSRIQRFEKKITEVSKKRKSIDNLITIKKGERQFLIDENKEIDSYIEQIDENIAGKKVLVKDNSNMQIYLMGVIL